MGLGTKIKKLREECGYSRESLAKFLDISEKDIEKTENGECSLSSVELKKLAELFCVVKSDLLVNGHSVKAGCIVRNNNFSVNDLIAISDINRIVLNANFMTRVLGD